MRIGIFGGTFDPVHQGHLIMAEQCREQAALDEVWFVPAARPPHKLARPLTPFAQRADMLELALGGHSAFRVEPIEKDRPGPSFSVDTLIELHQRHPGTEWEFILGADSLPDLPSWYEPRRLVELTGLLAVARPGWDVWPADRLRQALTLPADFSLRYQIVQVPLIDISSSDLRQRTAAGRSIRYLLPRAVECYIHDKRLYVAET